MLLVAVFVVAGCGSSDSSMSTAAGQLSERDAGAMVRVDDLVKQWNSAATGWSNAYKSADKARFLRAYDGYTQTLHETSMRIRLSSSQFEAPRLGALMRDLGDAYRAQFRAIVKVNDSVANVDLKAGQSAVAQLQRAGERKLRQAEKLADEYPVLGADLAG